ncbi:glutamate synthase large subunit [Alkalihalobacillus sp. AL-G]|uniref:glutamate synthase large subunit n=1 Tax=Alkalihalobacillus sp. AL-G TaxID=2926399 RepID=UPI00272A1B6F|nr:glutamate synthase large subunit [Alkalihalobacillus sp. AL-G]WLD91562.1 glutamate synthase large subunit [Alkalihalobacillus sp. AL-G]
MNRTGFPCKQGLYDPANEKDACGIGFVAQIDGIESHQIVTDALSMLCRLEHRGGQGIDPDSGDGAGIMLKIPDRFFRKIWSEKLPKSGDYAVGMVFLPQDAHERTRAEKIIEQVIIQEHHELIGWRAVPVQKEAVSSTALRTMPFIRQFFVRKPKWIESDIAFTRSLYLIRKRIEKQIEQLDWQEQHPFYIASLSKDVIVYKGMLSSYQLDRFYEDLPQPDFRSTFAMVHSRYSTNTFPSWERAHPNRMIMHNGEINTITGNVNWMKAREKSAESDVFGNRHHDLLPVISDSGSDSGMLDQAFEYLAMNGRSLTHTAAMMVPEAWDLNDQMTDPERACLEFLSCKMEPWDGPTALAYTDGNQIGALIDRNGLRPARFYLTDQNTIIFSSEVGVLDVEPKRVVQKGRLAPGEMILVDLETNEIILNPELKRSIATAYPYRKWLEQTLITLKNSEQDHQQESVTEEELLTYQLANGYTTEEVMKNILPMVKENKDPIGSMGNDTPLAVLSRQPQLLFNYFKQLFAQVTNPPIDAIREQGFTSTKTYLGPEGNVLQDNLEDSQRIQLSTPILKKHEFDQLFSGGGPGFKSARFSSLYEVDQDPATLQKSVFRLFEKIEQRVRNGVSLVILSDRDLDIRHAQIPSLLVVSGLHHHLVKVGLRTKASIIIETAEARDVHQFSALIGYGVDAIYPYVAYRTIEKLIDDEHLETINYNESISQFIEAATTGIVKVMSKMGISTIQSYRGAQTFEAIGISHQVIDSFFPGTASKLGGVDLTTIAEETEKRHQHAFSGSSSLESGGAMQWRHDGEHHAFNPKTIHTLQHACRTNDYGLYKQFSELASNETVTFLRDLLEIDRNDTAISIEEVESVESIWKRFKTGAMSYGSLSQEAHEILAIAMNQIGGKSNSGEGGEHPTRFTPDENGDNRRSAIKQVASGRFGVTSHYLVNADELQIKMAQGAKPGEGGHLPGKKVHPWIAEVRKSTPGVGLISPPPHHDIYSIEDLSQLIYDLKAANPKARISVKLVAKSGVGTIAAGVAKGNADVILISGYEGGTGASPKTSIRHAGLPWEIGLAEAHQTLILNGLRDSVVLETDGKLMTGKDVVKAALLGAEEFGFSTAPLVVLGCIMMRACHLDTCPVGIATQNPELRKKFMGKPEHVVNYMRFIAEEIRELMAQLGFRTMEEMIGRTEKLTVSPKMDEHPKARMLDLTPLLYTPEPFIAYKDNQNNDDRCNHLDEQVLIPNLRRALSHRERVTFDALIKNTDRAVGTRLGYEVTSRFGSDGLPDDTIHLTFKGSAGQSFGAFVPKGITLNLRGDGNDYVGKGLSGGRIIVSPRIKPTVRQMQEILIGNVALFGATSGQAFINGAAGERFAVRNSGADAVVEGVGDNGCEYMTGGRVIILGSVGKNFAAGMSGGISYIWSKSSDSVIANCNKELVQFEELANYKEIKEVKKMIQLHYMNTGSIRARYILQNWRESVAHFIKVIPIEYKRMQKQNDEQNDPEEQDLLTLS